MQTYRAFEKTYNNPDMPVESLIGALEAREDLTETQKKNLIIIKNSKLGDKAKREALMKVDIGSNKDLYKSIYGSGSSGKSTPQGGANPLGM